MEIPTPTRSDVEAFKEEAVRNLIRGDPERLKRELDGLPYPEEMPAYGEIIVDDMGNLWVQEYEGVRNEQHI